MIQQKAKWYREINKIVPIKVRPNLAELNSRPKIQESSGTDELGDWILINFVHGESTYYDYEVKDVEKQGVKQQEVITKKIKEEEWDQIEVDKQCEDTTNHCSSVAVDVSTLKSSTSTNSKLHQRISTTVKKMWSSITEYLS